MVSKSQGKIIKISIENVHNAQTFTCTIEEHKQKSLENVNILSLQIANKTTEKVIFTPAGRPLRI